MIKQWEEFQLSPNTRAGESIRVSLNPRGIFTLNLLAFNGLGEPESGVVLLFDKINMLIGMRKAPAEAKNAYQLLKQPKSNSWLIRARPFCIHHKILVKNTVVFNNVEVDEDKVLVLNLRDTSEVTPRAPRQKKEEAKPFVLGGSNS